MNPKKIALIAIPAIILVLAVYIYGYTGDFSKFNSTTSQSQAGCTKLSDTQYAPFTYLISSDQLSPDAQAALAGFKLDKSSLPNGNTTITLTPIGNPEYKFQSFTLRPGDKLYFIETSFGDDSPQQDTNLRDDSGIAVDSNGCVLS